MVYTPKTLRSTQYFIICSVDRRPLTDGAITKSLPVHAGNRNCSFTLK